MENPCVLLQENAQDSIKGKSSFLNSTEMRKIKINQISKEGSRYKVFINSDYKFYFSSLRKATKFQNEVSQYLTHSLFQLNDIYIDMFGVFRRIYFTIENPLIKRNLDQNIKQVSELIDLALNRSHFESIGSSLVISKINLVYDNLLNAYQSIRKWEQSAPILQQFTTRIIKLKF